DSLCLLRVVAESRENIAMRLVETIALDSEGSRARSSLRGAWQCFRGIPRLPEEDKANHSGRRPGADPLDSPLQEPEQRTGNKDCVPRSLFCVGVLEAALSFR